jgi:hypothetical protein
MLYAYFTTRLTVEIPGHNRTELNIESARSKNTFNNCEIIWPYMFKYI